MTLKNELYLKFKREGDIRFITPDDISRALANIKGRNTQQGRALLIAQYYTGARPVELSQIQSQDIQEAGGYITMKVKGAKRGLTRTIFISQRKQFAKELLDYAKGYPPGILIFKDYFGSYTREFVNKKGLINFKTEVSDKYRYHFKKWFKGVVDIPPYYLRHSRFSQLISKGASSEEIRILKGGKSLGSVSPYLHLSSVTGKKIAKYLE